MNRLSPGRHLHLIRPSPTGISHATNSHNLSWNTIMNPSSTSSHIPHPPKRSELNRLCCTCEPISTERFAYKSHTRPEMPLDRYTIHPTSFCPPLFLFRCSFLRTLRSRMKPLSEVQLGNLRKNPLRSANHPLRDQLDRASNLPYTVTRPQQCQILKRHRGSLEERSHGFIDK